MTAVNRRENDFTAQVNTSKNLVINKSLPSTQPFFFLGAGDGEIT